MNLIFLVLAFLIADMMFLFIIYKSSGWGISCKRDEALEIISKLPKDTTIRFMISGDLYEPDRDSPGGDLRNNISE